MIPPPLLTLPTVHFPSLLFTTCLLGCGSSNTTAAPSSDASASDAGADHAQPSGDAALGDTLEDAPDADNCVGIRCAAVEGGLDSEAQTGDAASGDSGAACADPGDCRLFSDMCGAEACTCVALAAAAADPVCQGPTVQCFRDPCTGQSATCRAGLCAAL
jgi:hypothetical protein